LKIGQHLTKLWAKNTVAPFQSQCLPARLLAG